MDKETMQWIATAHDELAEKIRTAFQPLVDAFVKLSEEWSMPPAPDHRRIMRKKLRRMAQP